MARSHYETLQQVFDDAYRGLAAQGFAQSVGEGGSCAYRGAKGRRCAIGHCISDAEYTPAIENASVATRGDRYTEAVELFDRLFAGLSIDTLRTLQGVHDCGTTPAGMVSALKNFARHNRLTIPDLAA